MATSTEKESTPKAKGGMLRIALFALLALAVAGAAGGGYFYLSSKAPSEPAAAKAEPPIFMPLEPFTVNLQPGGRNRFLHVAVTLKMADAASQAQLTQYLPEVRSRVLSTLSSREADTLATPEDKSRLSSEIQQALSQPFAPNLPEQKIASVMFTTFMLQ